MSPASVRAEDVCGVLAGPLFVTAFTVIGVSRDGYDWRRYPVSALANGHDGWLQRANFVLAGGLYCLAARSLACSQARAVGPRAVPALVFGAGAGLIGSGLFNTDVGDGFPPGAPASVRPTRAGALHNLFAIPIFAGIPAAALICAGSAVRRREHRWASYSAGSALVMVGAFRLFGAALGGAQRPRRARGGHARPRSELKPRGRPSGRPD